MDIGLYVHIPFCSRKCGYCDFYSTVADSNMMESFVDALLIELDTCIATRAFKVETLYVGGGTPTVLPIESFRRLCVALGRVAHDHASIEFTVEANPATLCPEKVGILRDTGVSRISLGAQSFHSSELSVLGRIHSPGDIESTAADIHLAGFAHFNLDLIFGIPGQTPASWSESLKRAVDLEPDHLACYGLTYAEGTPLRAQRDRSVIVPVEDELEAEMYSSAIDRLAAAGFEQYEISNFARPYGQCSHNRRYWMNLPGIGLGPSAASYLNGRRWCNISNITEYIRRIQSGSDAAGESEILSASARAGETAMLRLRLNEGLNCEQFKRDLGFDPYQIFAEPITQYTRKGLLIADTEHLALTGSGRLVADTVIADFLAAVPVD